GPGEAQAIGARCCKPAGELTELFDQPVTLAAGLCELRLELAAERGIELAGVPGEPRPQLGEVLRDALDAIGVEQELPLDLLDGVAVDHQLLHGVDPANRLGRVHAERAPVLALAPHPPAARQEALLDVL